MESHLEKRSLYGRLTVQRWGMPKYIEVYHSVFVTPRGKMFSLRHCPKGGGGGAAQKFFIIQTALAPLPPSFLQKRLSIFGKCKKMVDFSKNLYFRVYYSMISDI